jgi:hypothetical protein
MIEIAEFTAQQTLKLPVDIAARFLPTDRFVVWVDGDTVHLKRVTPLRVLDMVDQAPEGEPMSLDEINDVVHRVRRQRRAQ